MTLDPHVAVLFASTFCVALLMALSGIQKSALEWKRRRQICPSCGRNVAGRCTCR